MIRTKIFYINLAHRTDRRDNVIKELDRFKLNKQTERFNAVYGKNLDIENIPDCIISKKGKKDALDNNLRVYVPLTKGGIGVALSHMALYKKIIEENLDYALILEDDITLVEDFVEQFNTIVYHCPKDLDMLFLGYHNSSIKYITKDLNEYICKSNKVFGLFGYIVSNKGAQKLLSIFPITEQIDSEISNNMSIFNCYLVVPDNRIILSDESSIYSKFGTDIQVRDEQESKVEKFSMLNYESNKKNIIIFFVLVIIICIFVKYK